MPAGRARGAARLASLVPLADPGRGGRPRPGRAGRGPAVGAGAAPAGAAETRARLQRRRDDRLRQRRPDRPADAPAAELAGLLRRGHRRRQRVPAGQRGRRRLRLRRRQLRGLGRQPAAAGPDRGHGRRRPTPRATGWARSTAACSPTATPPFYGSMGGTHLNQPIVGMAATPDGKGYWLVAADGGIFSYGDAGFYGSTGSLTLNEPIVGMAPRTTARGTGSWPPTAASSTTATPTSTARPAARTCPTAVVGMVASPDGGGYLMATENGVVLPFGDAQAFGGLTLNPTATQISAIIGNNQGTGYWLLDPQAWQYSFSTATPEPMSPGRRHHRRRRGLADRARPRHPGRLLQPVRPLRAVVRAVRHLGLGAGGHPHPALRLHGRHLGLGRRPRRRPAADGHARRGRRRPLRHRAAEHRRPRCTSGS